MASLFANTTRDSISNDDEIFHRAFEQAKEARRYLSGGYRGFPITLRGAVRNLVCSPIDLNNSYSWVDVHGGINLLLALTILAPRYQRERHRRDGI